MEIYGSYRSNIALIRDAVAENKRQMAQVDQALVTFQSGLEGVEKEMLPVYKLTERLRGTQKNIDLCVQELHSINENFVAAQELAPILLNGSKFDQGEYVRALQKLWDAITFLENHRLYEGSAKALDQAKELLHQARKKCMADFVNAVGVLSRGSRDEESNSVVWSKPNKQEIAKIKQLLESLLNSNIDQTELLTIYSKQRFQVMKMFLCDDVASTSFGFLPSTPIAELTRRLKDIKTTLEAEKFLSERIFSNEELSNSAFRHACHPILETLKRDLETTSPATKLQSGPFQLLLVHELLVTRAPDFEALFLPPLLLRDRKGKGLDDPWVLPKLLESIIADVALVTRQKMFGFQLELTENIGVGDRSLSKDGNVHPVSSHVLSFLRQVCEHVKPLKILVAKVSNITPTSFIETIVMQLVETLQSKSAQFKGRGDLKQLFLANNFAYIANSFPHCTQSDELDIEAHIQHEIKPRIEEMRDTAIAMFIQVSYQSFQTFLIDPTEKLQYVKGSSLLTLESGRLLKEKFARFNAQLEDISKTQRQFIVAEPQIRHKLIQAAVETIIPQYTTFYNKYSVIQFSKKNSSKYLKYTPKAAEKLLKELFVGETMPVDDK